MTFRHIVPAAVLAALAVSAALASQAPNFYAVVDASGNLARGFNAVSATHINPGQYEVAFNKDVSGCGYTAAIGLSGSAGSSPFGTVNVARRGGNKKAIFVQTFDTTGSLSDLGFHVIVEC